MGVNRVLEVVFALSATYLFLSLLTSHVTELVSAFLGLRSKELELAIGAMLHDRDLAGKVRAEPPVSGMRRARFGVPDPGSHAVGGSTKGWTGRLPVDAGGSPTAPARSGANPGPLLQVLATSSWSSYIASAAAAADGRAFLDSCNAGKKDLARALMDLPVGWGEDHTDPGFWTRMLGWLVTAFAVSLGAPFWFDLLRRLAPAMRLTGPPPTGGSSSR